MGHDVKTRTPGIGENGVDHLGRVEDRRRRISQQRHPGVFLQFPQGHAPRVPLLLDALIKRVVVMGGVAEPELLVPEEDRGKAGEEQRGEAGQHEDDRMTMKHEDVP